MTDCVVLIPVLRRPHRVAPLLESLRATSGARPLFICSPDDLRQQRAVEAAGADMILLDRSAGPGDYSLKLAAGFAASTEPLILTAADDLAFHPGWFDKAAARLTDTIQVVGTNDLGSPRVMAGKHSCHFLMTRTYVIEQGTIDQPGCIWHPGYTHSWGDDEQVATAKHRGSWAMALDSHVEHLHPSWRKSKRDSTYVLGRRWFEQDRALFQSRKHLWGG